MALKGLGTAQQAAPLIPSELPAHLSAWYPGVGLQGKASAVTVCSFTARRGTQETLSD